MQGIITEYLTALDPAEAQTFLNLTLIPLLGGDHTDEDYLLLDQALSQGTLTVTEKDAAGSVPELRVENTSPHKVLILDGEELVGAKQNRIVNTTLLLPAESTTVIPVSCVEQGRWSASTPAFRSEKRMMNADLRAMKASHVHASFSRSGAHRSDQGALWNGIAERARRRGAASPSMAMSAVFDKDHALVADYRKAFHPVPGQLGALFLVNGRPAGLDGFGRRDTFALVFDKLLASYALDAVDRFEHQDGPAPQPQAEAFLEACRTARVEAFHTVGLGLEARLSSERVIGFALALDDRVLHLSAFSRTLGERRTGRMARSSTRRRHAGR